MTAGWVRGPCQVWIADVESQATWPVFLPDSNGDDWLSVRPRHPLGMLRADGLQLGRHQLARSYRPDRPCLSTTWARSAVYRIYDSGPRTEPLDTPKRTFQIPLGSSRNVTSCRDVTWWAKWNLGLYKYFLLSMQLQSLSTSYNQFSAYCLSPMFLRAGLKRCDLKKPNAKL